MSPPHRQAQLTLIKVMKSVSWDACVNTQKPRNVHIIEHLLLLAHHTLTQTHNKVTNSRDLVSQGLLKSAFNSSPAVLEPWIDFNASQGRSAHRTANTWHWLMQSQQSFTVMLHHRFEGINSACATLMEARENGASKWATVLPCVG